MSSSVNYIEPSLASKSQHWHHGKDDTESQQDLVANMGPRRLGKKSMRIEVSEVEILAENQQYSNESVSDRNMRDRGIINPGVGDIIEEDEENLSPEQEAVDIESDCLETASSGTLFNRLAAAETQKQSNNEQERANVIGTSGGFIFLLIAAALITASFIMSPVLETILCKFSSI